MLCPDFSSDPYFLRYESFDMNWRRRVCSRPTAFLNETSWNVLRREKWFHDYDWYSLIWFVWIHMLLLLWSAYTLSVAVISVFALNYELSTMHDLWLSRCTSPWFCMICSESSKHLHIGACCCPQEAVICLFTTWLERPPLRDGRCVKKFSNLLCLTECGFYGHLEEGTHLYSNLSM